MKNKRHCLFAMALFVLSPSGYATLQTSMPTMAQHGGVSLNAQMLRLTLGDAIYLGLRNNPSIRSVYLQRVAQKFDLRVAEDALRPQVVLKSSYRNTQGSEDRTRHFDVTPTASLLGEYGTRVSLGWTRQLNSGLHAPTLRRDGLDVAVVQPLLRGAGRDVTTAPVRLAQVAEQAERLNLKASVSRTIVEIISAYRELLRTQEQLVIVQQALKRAKSLLAANEALIKAGRMAVFDAVQTEADIAAQELGVEEVHNQLANSRLSLLRLLALDLSTQVKAIEVLEAEPISIDRQHALRLARLQQPEYLSTLLQARQAELNLVIATDQARWDLSLVAGANQVIDRYESGVGSGRRWDRYAGAQLEIPLGDRSSRQGQMHARVAVERQAIDEEDARQALESDVTTVVRELGTLWRQYQIAQRSAELSQRKLDIEREKLNAGRSSNFQVISFEGDLRHAQSARLDALIAYLNAQTRMELTLGMTLESWEIALNDH